MNGIEKEEVLPLAVTKAEGQEMETAILLLQDAQGEVFKADSTGVYARTPNGMIHVTTEPELMDAFRQVMEFFVKFNEKELKSTKPSQEKTFRPGKKTVTKTVKNKKDLKGKTKKKTVSKKANKKTVKAK